MRVTGLWGQLEGWGGDNRVLHLQGRVKVPREQQQVCRER